jgi:hypothetical protein
MKRTTVELDEPLRMGHPMSGQTEMTEVEVTCLFGTATVVVRGDEAEVMLPACKDTVATIESGFETSGDPSQLSPTHQTFRWAVAEARHEARETDTGTDTDTDDVVSFDMDFDPGEGGK